MNSSATAAAAATATFRFEDRDFPEPTADKEVRYLFSCNNFNVCISLETTEVSVRFS